MIKNTMLHGGDSGKKQLGVILVGESNRYAVSKDGLAWDVRETPWSDNTSYWISSICQAPDGTMLLALNAGSPTFYATSGAAGKVYRSDDLGQTWTLVDSVTYGVAVKYLHDAFFIREFGSSTHASSRIYAIKRSTGGLSFAQVDARNDIASLVHWMDYGAGVFVTCDGGQNNQASNPPRWSENGVTWADALTGGTPYGYITCSHGVAYGGGYFSTWMMRSNDGTYYGQHRSADGKNWSSANGTYQYTAGAGDFLYGARGNASVYSSDGLATQTTLGLPLEYPNVAFFDGNYVLIDCSAAATSVNNTVYHATDGVNFTAYSPPDIGDLISVQASALAT